MKIWVHIDGAQLGPFEYNELPLDRMTAKTPVWYEGLSYWMPAGQAPVTASLFQPTYTGEDASAGSPRPAERQRLVDTGDTDANGPDAQKKCPPNYLVWSVLLTVICCNPIGIISAIYGILVMQRFRNYNYDGAKRASETTEWWLMITIVTSLISLPLSILGAL